MEWVFPRAHFAIHESAGSVVTETGNVCVVIYEAGRIDIVESVFD
jgi:hypothetical protein